MGTVKNFEELDVWANSRQLVNLIYKDFKSSSDFTFKSQITSAGISIMNNIAEGFCRNSDAEFRNFLNISKASTGEVKSMYYIAEDLNYINSQVCRDRREACQQIMNSLGKFISYLKNR